MDKNTITGFLLIFAILFAWSYFTQPTPEQLAAQQRTQDSLAQIQRTADSLAIVQQQGGEVTTNPTITEIPDSIKQLQMASKYGAFAAAGNGTEELVSLENEKLTITFSTKVGNIKNVLLKEFDKIVENEERKEEKVPLYLLEDDKNKFEYWLPVANSLNGVVKTSELYFSNNTSGNTITFRADAGGGRYFEQIYTLKPDSYEVEYDVKFTGLADVLNPGSEEIRLQWVNYLDKIEKNTQYERTMSTVYYKVLDEHPDYCSCRADDEEEITEERIEWVANANQFFNSTLVADSDGFTRANLTTQMLDPEQSENMKVLTSELYLPFNGKENFKMRMYLGPNEYKQLDAFAEDLEYIIPFGRSILGTVNRYIIRPVFGFLSGFIPSAGLVILVMTFLIKLVLYPLTYKMLYSQQKMSALKPRIASMKEKFKDDSQKQQVETMKLYREFGVNPLGGCLPIFLQMPIWIALYRFFPASIEFRQASFLWANDLSSYDVFFQLPFEIPFFGAHISLFTLLWAITTLIYTYYNTKHMEMGANPAMKYVQYVMPIMFMGFFNSFAAGLTCYLLFSNLFNIAQTIITKEYIIDKEKILKELEAYKKKPKKQGGFQQRLEMAMKEQQKRQEGAKGKKKK